MPNAKMNRDSEKSWRYRVQALAWLLIKSEKPN
jgi:hypothetical protein